MASANIRRCHRDSVPFCLTREDTKSRGDTLGAVSSVRLRIALDVEDVNKVDLVFFLGGDANWVPPIAEVQSVRSDLRPFVAVSLKTQYKKNVRSRNGPVSTRLGL